MLHVIDQIAAAERRTARRRQPAEADREDDLQEQTEPERRQRNARDRDRRRRAIEPAAAADGGDDAGRQRQRERDDDGCADELERRRNARDDPGGDGTAVAEAVAPVALREGGEPRPVLLPKRAIETERAAQPLDVLWPDIRIRQVDRERSARRRVNEQEYQHRDENEERQGL